MNITTSNLIHSSSSTSRTTISSCSRHLSLPPPTPSYIHSLSDAIFKYEQALEIQHQIEQDVERLKEKQQKKERFSDSHLINSSSSSPSITSSSSLSLSHDQYNSNTDILLFPSNDRLTQVIQQSNGHNNEMTKLRIPIEDPLTNNNNDKITKMVYDNNTNNINNIDNNGNIENAYDEEWEISSDGWIRNKFNSEDVLGINIKGEISPEDFI